MTTTLHSTRDSSQQGQAASMEDMDAQNQNLASDMEIAALQNQIDGMNAKAQQIENEIAAMQAETGGAAGSSSELEHARQQAREMHSAADTARNAISNAPTDPKTGKKMISAKKVTNLSISIGIFLTVGEKESGAIKTATAETENKIEAQHEKIASKTVETNSVSMRCTRETVCAPVMRRPAHTQWVYDTMEQVQGFGSRVSNGVSQHWQGFVASASGVVARIGQLDVVGSITHAGHVVVETGSDVATKVSEGIHAGLHSVKEAAHSVYATVREKAQAGKVLVLSAVSFLNPFKDKVPEEAVAKTGPGPITIAESAMEKALGQAKAALSHGLPHISLPNMDHFLPTSLPFTQGFMGRMAVGF